MQEWVSIAIFKEYMDATSFIVSLETFTILPHFLSGPVTQNITPSLGGVLWRQWGMLP
jgi:hypothetical protein